MTRAQMLEEIEILNEMIRRKPVWKPFPPDPEKQWPEGYKSPQQMALASTAQIIGFGGSAGGGKSGCGIGMALMNHTRSLIVRRNYSDLEEIRKQIENIPDFRTRRTIEGVLEVKIPQGRNCKAKSIRLGHVDDPQAETVVQRYQGQAYDFIFVDEATHFLQGTIEYLLSRNRTTLPGQISQLLMTFNPPMNPEEYWIVDYFAPWLDYRHPLYGQVEYGQVLHRAAIARDSEDKAVMYWFKEETTVTHHPSTGELLREPIRTISVTFIRARLEDNPLLRDGDYADRLAATSDAKTYRALRFGEFSVEFDDRAMSIFKPQHWRVCVNRYKELQANGMLPKGRPDVISIDAALGGDDWMNVQHAHLPGIYLPQHKIVGKRVPSQAAQIEWLKTVPHILDARLYIIDCDGGYGQGIYEWLCAEMKAQVGNDLCVFAHKGSVNSKWTMPSWNLAGEGGSWAAQKFQHDTAAAWGITGQSMEFTEAAVPDDADLATQCLSRLYTVLSPYLAIEKKEDFKKRLNRSPDDADALCMAGLGLHCLLGAFGRP